LREKWPTISDRSFRGKLNGWSACNEFLFIRNDLAVLLAVTLHNNVDGRPYMRAIFAFARDGAPQSSSGEKASIALYRHMREWAKSQRATRAGLFRRAIRHWAGSASDALERRQGNGHLLSDRIAAALIVEPRVEKELPNARGSSEKINQILITDEFCLLPRLSTTIEANVAVAAQRPVRASRSARRSPPVCGVAH
jgi:hypothetical protein